MFRLITWTAAVFALSATSGAVLALKTEIPRTILGEVSYAVRGGLGLEKSWKALPGPEQAAGRKRATCPDPARTVVLITGGQSNATNVVPSRHRSSGGVFTWFAGRCYPGSDPLLGTGGYDGSLWSLLADRLHERISRPVLLINGAVGGTQFSDWIDARSGYYAALQARVTEAGAAGYVPSLILRHQGETDAAVLKDMAELQRDMTVLFQNLSRDMGGAEVYMFRATRCIGPGRVDGVPEVNAAQKRVAESLATVHLGLDTDLLDREYRWDTCHFNALGRAEIAKRVVPDLMQLLDDREAS
ncbi:sialate O-acetylesterase [Salipiger mangrovisoli]|uniref:sialate O-acetylesterase n=1 Tax=Salipiger mangrovisoli TaxID=2865933 RepID=UPI0030B8468A